MISIVVYSCRRMINIARSLGRMFDSDDREVVAQFIIIGSVIAGGVVASAAVIGAAVRVFVAVAG